MRARWLLLAVGVVCLLLVAPAAALSQEGTEIGCGSADIDGWVRTAEWADAVRLPMRGYYVDEDPDVIPKTEAPAGLRLEQAAQDDYETEGWLYLKNDERYLYVGATLDICEEDPEWWGAYLALRFTDEPCGDPAAWVDDEWNSLTCWPTPGEGWFTASEHQYHDGYTTRGPKFLPASEAAFWCIGMVEPAEGVIAKAGPHTAHYEMRIDMQRSQLNCVGPGDCLRFRADLSENFGLSDDPRCPGGYITEGWAVWPAWFPHQEDPDDFGTICLNPCEVEYVPEPGTVLLLGSGLLSLAGYAGLRQRSRA